MSDVHYELSHLTTGKHTKAHVQRLQAVFLPADTHADADDCFHQHRSAAVNLVPDFSDDSETDLDATSSVVPDPVRAQRRPVRSTAGVRSSYSLRGLVLTFLFCFTFMLFFAGFVFQFCVRCHVDMSP